MQPCVCFCSYRMCCMRRPDLTSPCFYAFRLHTSPGRWNVKAGGGVCARGGGGWWKGSHRGVRRWDIQPLNITYISRNLGIFDSATEHTPSSWLLMVTAFYLKEEYFTQSEWMLRGEASVGDRKEGMDGVWSWGLCEESSLILIHFIALSGSLPPPPPLLPVPLSVPYPPPSSFCPSLFYWLSNRPKC